jgi:hypothetical protein
VDMIRFMLLASFYSHTLFGLYEPGIKLVKGGLKVGISRVLGGYRGFGSYRGVLKVFEGVGYIME